jgi:hypothetical protein
MKKEKEPKLNSILDDRLKDLMSRVLKIGEEYTVKDVLKALETIKKEKGNEDLSLFLETPEANGRIMHLVAKTNFTRVDNYTMIWNGF